ncbi:hypothetical protein D9623_33795 (plasmid) [Azospirillum brasilense]|uniref:Uncharacterized protein n=1 Tax=Azospirillum brasilense TaxID=192 RepID=Q6QW45_AZOBR|nr:MULTISPECIES: hypothetical protein [Azospirillum]YP_001686849.1 hypothetical protein APCd_gp08 [Azospirillum phage Cd]AAS83075.1 hypothetical protein pRhico087 [Azospirillum brasilense]MDW7555414.1 hypothetical protein [Azospirillum brasilense]MDW7595178.1 hypothetical protein [Azospirillum brasilense]MDW7630331.1 hypothetical protein [Azospirillum brasilense]MDX5949699.1 hypothetical protein [Azospirillum brasilense]
MSACTVNPFIRENWSPTMAEVDARKARARWAFQPSVPHNKTPLPVTDRDRASIEAAVAAGKVRRVGFDGKELV